MGWNCTRCATERFWRGEDGDWMNTYIVLLRGINVGGRRTSLPMRELVEVLEGLGLQNVRTYIQSGNVIFQHEDNHLYALPQNISTAILESHGFAPEVMLLGLDELENAVAANPYPEAEAAPKSLHLFFLKSAPKHPDVHALEAIRRDSERYTLKDKVLYLHTPEGLGRSKLATRAEKILGVAATARNWRSVNKILALAKS